MTESMYEAFGFLQDNADYKYIPRRFGSTGKWLAARSNNVGASEVAAILGKSPWMTARELWERKMHPEKIKPFSNADTARGHMSEAHIRELYGIEMGVHVYDGTNIMLESMLHRFMACTLDGFFMGENGPCIMEIKSVRGSNGDWSEDRIPIYYLLQVLAQLAVTGWKEAILVARFCRNAGWDKAFERTYHVHASDYEKEIKLLSQMVENFWMVNVIGKKAPAVKVPSV